MNEKQHDAIAVVDFGGQYAHLIANKIRRQNVLSEIRQPEEPPEVFSEYRGIVLSGSPALTSQGDEPGLNRGIFDLDIPILGICFGHQEIAHHYGGQIVHQGREWGHATFHVLRSHPLFSGMDTDGTVWMSHNDSVVSLGDGFEELGYTFLGTEGRRHPFAAIGSDTLRRYGVQFHPEVDDTAQGEILLSNFVKTICGCQPTWTMASYLETQVEQIRRQVGEKSVFLLASGGVDSTVAAILFARAIGTERLHLLHIDNGLMRKGESRQVLEMYRQLGLGEHLHFHDATDAFLSALGTEIQPEAKRRIIGDAFVEVFDREARRLGIEDHLLGQGTIYPDTIETGGTRRSDTIKTHHNRVPIIEELIRQGKVIEPLADLYKVEVRELGEKLGIPARWVWRHPFPGPGLGVRLLCSDGQWRSEQEQERTELEAAVSAVVSPYGVSSCVLPIRSVGVKADLRTYEFPVLITGAVSFEQLEKIAGILLREVKGINRCLWNLQDTAPDRLGRCPAFMSRTRLDVLRDADALVMEGLRTYQVYEQIWQCPTVFLPMRMDEQEGEFCVLRPIYSERAMTARAAALPDALLAHLRTSILSLPGVLGVALDITSKPPGTIEWE